MFEFFLIRGLVIFAKKMRRLRGIRTLDITGNGALYPTELLVSHNIVCRFREKLRGLEYFYPQPLLSYSSSLRVSIPVNRAILLLQDPSKDTRASSNANGCTVYLTPYFAALLANSSIFFVSISCFTLKQNSLITNTSKN